MNFVSAYLRAFWDIGRVASALYLVSYPFMHYKALVAWYLGYLVVVSSFGGPIKVLMDK